jgi:hypothetical protein
MKKKFYDIFLVFALLLLFLRGELVLVGVLARVRLFSPYAVHDTMLEFVACQRLTEVVVVALVTIMTISLGTHK